METPQLCPSFTAVYKQNGMITRSSVLQLEVLIGKLPAVNRLPSSSIVVGEISTLKTHTRLYLHCNSTPDDKGTQKKEIKTPTWHMNWGITLWKVDPLYPKPCSPVHSALKFSKRKIVSQIVSDDPYRTFDVWYHWRIPKRALPAWLHKPTEEYQWRTFN